MFKASVFFFVAILSFSLAKEDVKSLADQDVEQIRERELLDLIESLEDRIKTAEEAENSQTESTISNPRDRKAVRGKQDGQDRIAEAARVDHSASADLDKRRSDEKDDELVELRREMESLRKERVPLAMDGQQQQQRSNGLSDSEREEQYFRSLVRLQRMYRLFDKRFGGHEEEEDGSSERQSRHCVGDLIDRRIERLQASKLRHQERDRLLADRLSDAALRLGRARTAQCGRRADGKAAEEKPRASPSPEVARSRPSPLVRQLNSCEDHERKMIMDMAIEDAAEMIRRLSSETRAAGRREPQDDRRILGLAIDLVNKVTAGATGEQDPLEDLKYKDVDDYVRSSHPYEPPPMLSSAGFDYVDYPDNQLDYEVGYPGPRCDTCARYDLQHGHVCPMCKRSGQARDERTRRSDKVHHLRKQTERQRKSGGVWEDVNKLYNFDDLENDKFIDLSLNCTGVEDNEDCMRLQRNLVAPQGVKPVPLWYVKEQLSQARDLARDMYERALELQADRDGRPSSHSPSQLQYLGDRVPGHVVRINEESHVALLGTKLLREKLIDEYNMTSSTFKEFLEHHGFRVTGSEICRARQDSCDDSAKYRSLDGSCNNEHNPSWGQSYTALVRMLPPRYADGVQSMPVSVTLGALPNPRQLSSQLFPRRNAPDPRFTLAFMQWGQLVAHDFARSVADQTAEGGIECCKPNGRGPLASSRQHHSCMPIGLAGSDRFYSVFNVSCMNFVRSMTVIREDCSLGRLTR